MKKIFGNKDLIIFNQPYQSLVASASDACAFIMMSKKLSGEQAKAFGGKLLRNEELIKTMMKVFNDGAHLPAITRSFARHS